MRWFTRFGALALFSAITFGIAAGCGPAELGGNGASCRTTADCRADQTCVRGTCMDIFDAGRPYDAGPYNDAGDPHVHDLVSIAIMPDHAALVSTDGSMPDQIFAVVGTHVDGTTTPIGSGALLTISTLALGDFDAPSGHFVSNGLAGGDAMVTATVAGPSGLLTATAMLSVRLERTILAAGTAADAATHFAMTPMTDPMRAASLVYPLDGAVMPQNVYPADIQWLNGAAGDVFRITFTKPHAHVVAYVTHSGASFHDDWLVDAPAWRSLATTDPDAPMTISVDRFDAAASNVVASDPRTMRFARAALTGSIYYWDIAAGRIIRIDDGTATRVNIMPNPPVAIDGAHCVGCHTVSPSGRYMVGRLGGGDNIGTVFDLTVDLTGNPPPSLFPAVPSGTRWWFSSWSPDERRLIVEENLQLGFLDPRTGMPVPVASGTLPASQATHPAWSPDGTAIAYAANTNDWGGMFTAADIGIIPVTGPDSVGAPIIIQHGADLSGSAPGGVASAYPTWTPDSARIAFAHGTGCRSETEHSALQIMNRDGTGVVRLDHASGGTMTGDSFQPRFSPFRAGGYFWLSFLTSRDYGNASAGTRGSGRQQIWVTAIRDSAGAGDPSEVAYWLPGQDTASRNISAYWAPRPCRADGESCAVGSECCGGDCRPGPGGALVCAPVPPDRCRMEGETCSGSNCCAGLTCFANVCIVPPG